MDKINRRKIKEYITMFPKINSLWYKKRESNRFDCIFGYLFDSFKSFKLIEDQIVDNIDKTLYGIKKIKNIIKSNISLSSKFEL